MIETKNYKGWIFGNEKSKYWTQTLYKRKFKIFNPVIQNWTHVSAVKRISGVLKNANYFPIIVFTGKSKLKRIDSTVPVVKKKKLIRIIKRHREVYYTYEQLAKMEVDIRNSLASGRSVKKEHIKNVKRNIKQTKNRKKTGLKRCPKCGGKLITKNGRFGWFYSCINYPECKFTRNFN